MNKVDNRTQVIDPQILTAFRVLYKKFDTQQEFLRFCKTHGITLYHTTINKLIKGGTRNREFAPYTVIQVQQLLAIDKSKKVA